MTAAALLLTAAVVTGDFGSSPTAILWRSALDEDACSREIAELGRPGGRCKQGTLAALPEGARVEVLTDTRGRCTSRRARLTRVRASLGKDVTAIGCLFSEDLK